MAEDADNHTIKLLQEMRKEISEQFKEINTRFDDVDTRIDGVSHIMTLMAGYSHDLDERVAALEAAVETPKSR